MNKVDVARDTSDERMNMCPTSPGATPHRGPISRNYIDVSIGETRTSPRL